MSTRKWDVQVQTPGRCARCDVIKFREQFGENRLHYANILGYAMQCGDAVSVVTFI